MIKMRELGMFATAKNDPTHKAHANIKNGYLCTLAAGKTVALPTVAAAKVAVLKIAMLHHNGEEVLPETIKKDEFVVAFDVDAWKNQHLIVTADHLSLGVGEDFDDVVVGTIFVACDATTSSADAGKFLKVSAATGYNIYFTVAAKTTLGGQNAVDLLINSATSAHVVV